MSPWTRHAVSTPQRPSRRVSSSRLSRRSASALARSSRPWLYRGLRLQQCQIGDVPGLELFLRKTKRSGIGLLDDSQPRNQLLIGLHCNERRLDLFHQLKRLIGDAELDRLQPLRGNLLFQGNHEELSKLLSHKPRVPIQGPSSHRELHLKIQGGIGQGDRLDQVRLRDSDFFKRHLQTAIVQKRDMDRAGDRERVFQQPANDGGGLCATRQLLLPANVGAGALSDCLLNLPEGFGLHRCSGDG